MKKVLSLILCLALICACSVSLAATTGEKNALASALQYLAFTNFSYSGLVKQLKFEGFSDSEAAYAADNCGADWKEQAVGSAENYMSFMAFSKSGLVDQLIYEGFTKEQAEYGASVAYGETASSSSSSKSLSSATSKTSSSAGGTVAQKNTLASAQNYLEFTHFSKSGLINQLMYEGYEKADATYAAEHCGADWYDQAVGSAEQYLSFMSFSKSSLIDQLVYEGFTKDEAKYGASVAYGESVTKPKK